MGIEPFRNKDMERFLLLAAREEWICDRWEPEFLISSFPQGCLVWREDGEAIGFVTAIRYSRSGWLGNLIVEPKQRGRGIGRQLMVQSMASLAAAGSETLWLTASGDGEPIYARLGFQPIDTIIRWRGYGRGDDGPLATHRLEAFRKIDQAGWGDDRGEIFEMLRSRSTLLTGSDSYLYRHKYPCGVQIGPWGGFSRSSAGELLSRAISGGGETKAFFLDLPEKNMHAAEILTANGFHQTGGTRLMYHGRPPSYNPLFIYALASMGSFG